MAKIIIPGFKGGQSLDKFDSLEKQTFQSSKNLDIYVDSNILKPVMLKFQSMAIPALAGQTDVLVKNSYLASNGKFYFVGQATITAANNFVLWSTAELAASPSYTTEYNANTGTPTYLLEEYKDGLFFGWGTNLDRFGNLSGSPSRSNIGTVTTAITHLRNHRGLGVLFFAHNSGHTIGKYDNSTFTATALTLGQDDTVVGMEEYGRWLIIGVRGAGSNRSRFLVWDGSATTVDDVYETNDYGLQGFKIVGGVINYVSLTANGANDYIRLSTLTPGGKPEIIKEQQVVLSSGANTIDANATSSFGNLFFYGLNGITYSNLDLGIFAHGSAKVNLPKFHTLWRLVSTGATSAVSISSIKHNGTTLIVTWGTTNGGGGTQHIDVITGSGITSATPSDGVYESNAFLLNGGQKGKIKKITIFHKPLVASTGFTAQIKHYGHYPIGTSIPSEDSYADLTTSEGSGSSTGKTQSTTNTTYTIIQQPNVFKEATHAQIKILFDEVSGTSAPEIVFPIIIEVE